MKKTISVLVAAVIAVAVVIVGGCTGVEKPAGPLESN